LKEVGDKIEADEAVLEIATDKVDSEVPSEVSGVLLNNCLERRFGSGWSNIAIMRLKMEMFHVVEEANQKVAE
jgi:2-oxoglutarate dehydrogenase E2 component (dihydrolipoamide succinyltransferase)